jgi:hypothetical protein
MPRTGATRLLVDREVNVDDIVTAVLPLAKVADAYALSSGGEHVKVLVGVGRRVARPTR